MSAICGVVGLDSRPWTPADLAGVVSALRPLGPDGGASWSGTAGRCGVAISALLRHATVEDAADSQPVRSHDGSIVLVADIRLDNRSELAGLLGVANTRTTPDTAFLLAAYQRWGEAMLERLVGEFAFAIVDRRRGGVLLARDHAGARPLAIHERPGVVAFASMPPALTAFEDVGHSLDMRHAAEVLALAYSSHRTFVDGVRWLPAGSTLWITADGVRQRRWWNPDPHETTDLGSPQAHAEELRRALEAAVSARLRASGGIGAFLSGGLDSTSVAATAARLVAPDPLPTFTSVPRPGWRGGERPGWDADESSLVQDLVAIHPNVVPTFVEAPPHHSFLTLQEPLWELGAGPARNPCNMLWLIEIRRQAGSSAVTALLNGDLGNLFFSADGPGWLVAHVRAGRVATAWREARAWRSASGEAWTRIVRSQLAQVAPPAVVGATRRLARRSTLRQAWLADTSLRSDVAADLDLDDLLPQLDERRQRDTRAVALSILDHFAGLADVSAALTAVTGAAAHDPLVDRRLVEVAMRQPEWTRRHDGISRAVVRDAMSDRLPEAIVQRSRRGEQLPDWFDLMSATRGELAAELEEIEGHPSARTLIDTDRLRGLIERWPDRTARADARVVSDYRLALLRGLVIGRYLRWFETRRNVAASPGG